MRALSPNGGHHSRGAAPLRLQDGGDRQVAQHAPNRPLPWGRSTAGPPVIGFDYFYGFMGGETSQWEPRLYENINPVEPPHDELSPERGPGGQGDRLVGKPSGVLARQALLPLLGAGRGHGPHHIFKEWADKYKGKFDDGWDAIASASSRDRKRSAGSRRTPSSRHAPRRWQRGTTSPRRSARFSAA